MTKKQTGIRITYFHNNVLSKIGKVSNIKETDMIQSVRYNRTTSLFFNTVEEEEAYIRRINECAKTGRWSDTK